METNQNDALLPYLKVMKEKYVQQFGEDGKEDNFEKPKPEKKRPKKTRDNRGVVLPPTLTSGGLSATAKAVDNPPKMIPK